jgi:hypothetical protein
MLQAEVTLKDEGSSSSRLSRPQTAGPEEDGETASAVQI